MRRPGSRQERRERRCGAATASPKDKRAGADPVPPPLRPTVTSSARGGRRDDHVRTSAAGRMRSGPVGEATAPADRVQPRLGALAHRARGDDEQLVAVPQHVVVAAARTSGPRARRATRWPPPAAAARTPARRRSATPARCRSRAARPRGRSSGVVSTARSTRWWAAARPSRRATQGSVGACTTREDRRRARRRGRRSRSRRGCPGCRARSPARPAPHRAARPTTGRPGCATTSRTAGTTRAPTAGGRAATGPRPRRGPARARSRKSLGCASSPSSTNRPIWASQPIAVANPSTAGRCGSRRLPSTSAAR